MQITRSFDGLSLPTFSVSVRGPVEAYGEHTFEAGVDTGFTGFLSLPFVNAIKPGLIFGGVMSLTLADGNIQSFPYCLGVVRMGENFQAGIIIVSSSSDVLVGMEFLKQFGFQLIVDPCTKTARLTDEEPPIQVPVVTAPPKDTSPS